MPTVSNSARPDTTRTAMNDRLGATDAPTRTRRPGLVAAAVASLAILCAACGIDWTYNRNFGFVAEPGAVRASLAIYREPRKLLYTVYSQNGIRPVQDIIYAAGNGPLTKITGFCVAGVCLQDGFIRSEFHSLVYDRSGDLAEALANAQANLDCLDLTLISGGTYAPNWTHKSVGCQIGAL